MPDSEVQKDQSAQDQGKAGVLPFFQLFTEKDRAADGDQKDGADAEDRVDQGCRKRKQGFQQEIGGKIIGDAGEDPGRQLGDPDPLSRFAFLRGTQDQGQQGSREEKKEKVARILPLQPQARSVISSTARFFLSPPDDA